MDRSYPSLTSFDPRLDILPAAQRAVWPRLVHLPIDAVLYGGTAIALRLGHRASVDFDLFLPRSFEPGEMRREVAGLGPFEVVRTAVDTLSVIVDDVWVSLFGVKLASVASPEVAADSGLPVASLLDVGATKMQTIVDRAESRDYLDIAEILAAGLPFGRPPRGRPGRLRTVVLADARAQGAHLLHRRLSWRGAHRRSSNPGGGRRRREADHRDGRPRDDGDAVRARHLMS